MRCNHNVRRAATRTVRSVGAGSWAVGSITVDLDEAFTHQCSGMHALLALSHLDVDLNIRSKQVVTQSSQVMFP